MMARHAASAASNDEPKNRFAHDETPHPSKGAAAGGGFEAFDLPLPLRDALKQMKFKDPTPIQALAIPAALRGADLIAKAQTGTGKTAAFAVPAIAKLLADPTANALVLAPTRELAHQVAEVFQNLLARAPRINGAVLTGGASMMPQLRSLSRRPRVIVATPGRLIDHLERGSATLDRTRILVLDEADRMLDMGFAPQLERILKSVPAERQTLLFSATLPPDIQRLAGKFMKDAEKISVAPAPEAYGKISQRALRVRAEDKDNALLEEINAREGSILVFAGTQRRTDRLASYLDSYGVKVESIHGGRTQGQRNRALQGLRDGRVRVLVATDVAARGLDVPCVAHVINYDLPMVAEDYVHRIGRTGRAGRSGEAVSLVSPIDRSNWLAIRRLLHKTSAAEQAARPMQDEVGDEPRRKPEHPSARFGGGAWKNSQKNAHPRFGARPAGARPAGARGAEPRFGGPRPPRAGSFGAGDAPPKKHRRDEGGTQFGEFKPRGRPSGPPPRTRRSRDNNRRP